MKKTVLLTVTLALSIWCVAQQTDSLAIFKHFIAISKGYQHTPLQASMLYTKKSNIITSETDTSTTNISLVFQTPTTAYIKFGNIEQIVTDTMVAMVNYDIKRMVFFQGTKKEMQSKMMKIGQTNYPDSAYKILTKRYKAETETMAANKAKISLISHANLNGTTIPKETIEMLYNINSKEPIEMITTKRYLKTINDSSMLSNKSLVPYIINIPDKGIFLMLEQIEQYAFNNISHKNEVRLPVVIADRVVKNALGEMIVAKGFETFTMAKQ